MMDFDFINVGFGNFLSINRLVAVVGAHSSPVKKLLQNAKEQGFVIDATYGRKTRSVILIDSGHIVLSFLQKETISRRLDKS